jgi:hypothetical protein
MKSSTSNPVTLFSLGKLPKKPRKTVTIATAKIPAGSSKPDGKIHFKLKLTKKFKDLLKRKK